MSRPAATRIVLRALRDHHPGVADLQLRPAITDAQPLAKAEGLAQPLNGDAHIRIVKDRRYGAAGHGTIDCHDLPRSCVSSDATLDAHWSSTGRSESRVTTLTPFFWRPILPPSSLRTDSFNIALVRASSVCSSNVAVATLGAPMIPSFTVLSSNRTGR